MLEYKFGGEEHQRGARDVGRPRPRSSSATGKATTPAAHKILDRLADVGLGYLSLGQPLTTLSGGERQRLKLATHMAEKGDVYVLDEPTTGLHLADVEQLLGLLDRLVDSGKSVIVIEHHQAVMAHADWIIDLGPGAGHDGGRIVFEGTPADLVAARSTLTGEHLAAYVGDLTTGRRMPVGRTAMPATRTAAAGDDGGEGQHDGEGDAAGEAQHADPSRPSALISGQGQAGGVGDRVVGEDGDAGEADRASKVERRGQHDDDRRHDGLGAQRAASGVRRSLRTSCGSSWRRAIASTVRETPGMRLSRTPRAAMPAPTRTIGVSQSNREVLTTRPSGASLAAMASTGTAASRVTPTAA